jgi:F-type H+-transporting ATPase subunit a
MSSFNEFCKSSGGFCKFTLKLHTKQLKKPGAHAEPTDVKSEIKAFIGHHVLDSHDFTFLSDEVEEEHYGFSLPIILWDNGIHLFSSLDLIMEKQWQNLMVISMINHHDGKIYKTDASGTLTEEQMVIQRMSSD